MANAFVAAFEILSFGAIIVLIVLGLGIIASMMGIFNFAQGEFVLLGAYITYLAYAKGMPIWAGMVAAPFVVGALGFALEALIIRRFYAAPIVAMLGTYALGLIIRESVRGLIGGFYLTVPEPIGDPESRQKEHDRGPIEQRGGAEQDAGLLRGHGDSFGWRAQVRARNSRASRYPSMPRPAITFAACGVTTDECRNSSGRWLGSEMWTSTSGPVSWAHASKSAEE